MFSVGLLIGLNILGSLCLVVLVLMYVSWRYVDYLESLMPRSECVLGNKRNFSDAGLPGKMVRFGSISMMLAFSKFSVRKGMANADDIKRFPKHIKIMLVSFLFFTYFVLGALLVAN
ncbi:hypothetical protein WP8W18C01_43170 [Pseudomonas putida]|uniref:Uncharacterized protein n=1 Tax=Pseudomonas putida TaxID=303 RepID=A0A6S5TXK4_PSEPU|nr:hypothetical protein WP8W18C01_43170 [Pseudomonas putida]